MDNTQEQQLVIGQTTNTAEKAKKTADIPSLVSHLETAALVQASLIALLAEAGPHDIDFEGLRKELDGISFAGCKSYSQLTYNTMGYW